MILIVTHADDQTARVVEEHLRRRGATVQRFDPAELPGRARLSQTFGEAKPEQCRLHTEHGDIDLHAVHTVWFRRPGTPQAPACIADPAVRRYVEAECAQRLDEVWNGLPCRNVPAAPNVIARASQKALQLELAVRLGFEIPPTLVTNDADDVLDFHRCHGGSIVSKLCGPTFHAHFGQRWVRYTEAVSARDLAQPAAMALCPMTFQANVPKRLELRITVVGTRAFAAEIHSQATRRTRQDWRRYDLANTPHHPHTMPAEVEHRCAALVAALGLQYGAIDLILTPEGRYVFLEINPNGQFQWIEQKTGLPISEALADLLAEAPVAATRQPREALAEAVA